MKCPYLINEIVNIVAQLVALAHAGRGKKTPILFTVTYITSGNKCSELSIYPMYHSMCHPSHPM